MKKFLSRMKEKLTGGSNEDFEGGFEGPPGGFIDIPGPANDDRSKVLVSTYILEDFEGIKPVCDALREGRSIVLLNIKPLREKDVSELKRAIGKLKKTVDALDGEIRGFSEDMIIVTPSFATISTPVPKAES
jgi:SepF-like predicted cell division protein (DUF552 family)